MKILSIFMAFVVSVMIMPSQGFAADIMVDAPMQACTANEDCILVSNECQQSCGFLPVNKAELAILQQNYVTKCGKPMDSATPCAVVPPLEAACINARCTISNAFETNSSPKDYQSGAYGVPEAPTPNKVEGDFTAVNDKKDGFSAYNLPQGEVKQKTVGQIFDKIYVPADAPVTGAQYEAIANTHQAQEPVAPPAPEVVAPPVAQAPTAQAPTAQAPTAQAPMAKPPVQPAAPEPQTLNYPSKPVVSAKQTQEVPAEPTAIMPAPAMPAPTSNPKPMADMPVMTPTRPNQSYVTPKLAPPTAPPSVPSTSSVPPQDIPAKDDVTDKVMEQGKTMIPTPPPVADLAVAAPPTKQAPITDMPAILSEDENATVEGAMTKAPTPSEAKKSFSAPKKTENINLN